MKKILLVEDNHDNAALVKKILVSNGFDYHWAQTGAVGLKMALEIIPDLILLDLGLPDVDGQTLSTWIRAERNLHDVPLIVMTAWPPETAEMMVKAYQLDGYVGKPFAISALLEEMEKHLED